MTGLKNLDIQKCLYCKTTAWSRCLILDSTQISPRFKSTSTNKMPKSFLVKKRVVLATCNESQELSDAEKLHEPGKPLEM